MSSYFQLPVTLELGVRAHNLLLEEYPLAERDIKPVGPDKWLLKTNVCDYRGIARFAIGLADDVKIIDSPEFQRFVSAFVAKYLM